MERSDISDKMVIYREICSLLLVLFLGIFLCIPLAMITCFILLHALSIDILVRFVILLICAYVASMYVFLTLPQQNRINICRLRTWRHLRRRLLRNVRLTNPSRRLLVRLQRNEASVQENLKTPLLQEENHDRQYRRSQRRRRTMPIDIVYPETYIPPMFVSNPAINPENEITPVIIKTSNGSITSIYPSAGDIEEYYERQFISEDSTQEYGTPDIGDHPAASHTRQVTLASDAQSTAHTDNGKLAVSGNVLLRLEDGILYDLKPVPDVPVTNDRQLDGKYFEVGDDEKLVIDRELELEKSGNNIPKIHTKSNKKVSKNEYLRKSSDLQRIQNRNLRSEGATSALLPQECSNARENPLERLAVHNRNYESKVTTASKGRIRLSKLETRLKFSDISGKNQKSCLETTRKERENATRSRNYETSLNFPRFPWINLRNPKGVSARANKLHRKNLELEKREIQRYAEMRHRRQTHIDRMIRSLLGNLRYQKIVGTGQSNESFNLRAGTENLSLESNKSTDKPIVIKPTRGTDKTNVRQTTSRYGATKEQEMVNISSNAEDRSSLLFSQKSDRQDYSADQATHRQLPSQKFQIKTRPRSKIDDKTETKSSFMFEKHTTDDEKDAESRMTYEASSSNMSKLEGAIRTNIEPVETAAEGFNRLQLDDLREKLVHMEQGRTYLNMSSAAKNSKQIIGAKSTEMIREQTLSTMPSGEGAAENQDVKLSINSPQSRLESDRDSDI